MNLIESRSVWLFLLAMALCCGVATAQTRNASTVKPELVTASNRFGFALLPKLEEQRRGTNIFYSPLSMTLALSMAYNGAGGRTEQAMRRTLGLEKLSLEELNQASASLLEELTREDAALKLTIPRSRALSGEQPAEGPPPPACTFIAKPPARPSPLPLVP